jgi:DNA-binding CsgD family transcriptional regulator
MDDALRELLMKLDLPTENPKKTYAEEKAEWESFFPEIPYPVVYNPLLEPSQSSKLVILPAPDPLTTEAGKWLNLIKHPCVVLILGGRGKGKSALGYRLLEYLRWGAAKVYAVGLPSEARKLLPEWIGVAASLEDVPGKSIVLVDEAYVPYHARAGTTVGAKTMSRDGNLSRQREQTIIFVTQEARQIDKNIASSADVVVFKEVSMLQLKFDRRELNDLAIQARAAFATIKGDKRQWSFVCVLDTGFAGLVQNTLPTFWKEKLSHVFAAGGEAIAMAPKKTPLSQRIEKAKELALQGLSQGEIAKLMGVSRPTVGNWLKSYPYKR